MKTQNNGHKSGSFTSARHALSTSTYKQQHDYFSTQKKEAERVERLKASRQTYGKRVKAATLGKSQPTVSEEELNKIVSKGWDDAEKLKAKKQKKRIPTANKKRVPIKSQNTI
jgi:hypothetical protein